MIFVSYSRLFKITKRISPHKKNALSSAKLHILEFSMNKKILFTKILKSKGPKIDPWGIPLVTHEAPIVVLCSRKHKQSLAKLRPVLSRPYASSFAIKRS